MNKLKGRGVRYYKMRLGPNYKPIAIAIKDKYYTAPSYKIGPIHYSERYFSEEYLKEYYCYQELIHEIIDRVSSAPLVKNIIDVKIVKEEEKLLVEVCATMNGIFLIKLFKFIIDSNNKIYFMDDLKRERNNIFAEL